MKYVGRGTGIMEEGPRRWGELLWRVAELEQICADRLQVAGVSFLLKAKTSHLDRAEGWNLSTGQGDAGEGCCLYRHLQAPSLLILNCIAQIIYHLSPFRPSDVTLHIPPLAEILLLYSFTSFRNL